MKRSSIFLSVSLLTITIGGLLLFAYGGSRPKILSVQDKCLTIGDDASPLKIVEYTDVLCPYCVKVNEEVVPRIKADYIDTKKAHYEISLVAMVAPDSKLAAEGAYCTAEQNKFWEYMDMAYKET